MCGGEIEMACCTYHHPSDMGAHSRKPLWDHRPHLIAGLKAEIASAPLAVAGWEAQRVGIAHLATASTSGRDQQGDHPLSGKRLWRRFTHARGT